MVGGWLDSEIRSRTLGGLALKDIVPHRTHQLLPARLFLLSRLCLENRVKGEGKRRMKLQSVRNRRATRTLPEVGEHVCMRVCVVFACNCRVMFKGKQQLGLKSDCLNYAALLLGANFLEQEI